MKQWLASVLLAVTGVVSSQTVQVTTLDPSQVYSTGNLVNNTTSPSNTTGMWQNVGSWNQGLPCWSPQDAWYYGAYCGPAPYFNNGSFNFSYGVTDVHQYVSIANALPNTGTGLRVNGYTFGFVAKNGNGWDGAGLDTLSAYVNFNGADGKSMRYDYYDLNYQFDWTAFNFSKTFDTPYASKDLSTVRYGFVGGDTSNYWAGPYGPEVINVSFSLNYSVDTCAINVLSSPTCPGYADALAKLLPPLPTVDPTTATATTETPTTTVTTTVVDSPISPTVTVTSTPSAGPAPAVAGREQQSSGRTDNSLALSIISRNQQREQSIVNQTVQMATSTANDAARASQQEAAAVAASAVANSTSSSSIGLGAVGSVGFRLGSASFSAGISQSMDLIQGPESSARVSSMLTDRTNPLNEYVEPRAPMDNAVANPGTTVNRNAANNEAASGVDLTKMAIAPAGYADYLNLALRDAAFYAPKEVYRNQRTIDNLRALRQMSSDKLHQQMTEQQYRSQP